MATLPATAVGEVRLTLRIPNGDGTDAPAVGYAWLYPNLTPGTTYRASNVDPQVAAKTKLTFDTSGNLEDPETDAWAKVLGSDAPGASFPGMQWVLEFHLENVDRQPAKKFFTVPAGSYVNVGLLADTSSQPSTQTVYLDASFPALADGQVADLIADDDSDTSALLNKWVGALNVRRFGAAGDGVTDDTAAIQAAHDALPARGGALYFPPGKYQASGITISKPVVLAGAGSGDHTSGVGNSNTDTNYDPTSQGSVIFTASATATMFTVNASGFTVTDLAIVCTHAAPTAGYGIRITRGDGSHLARTRLAGFWVNVSIEQYEYATITDCLIIDPLHYGLWVRNLSSADQGDMTISGTVFSYSGAHNTTGGSAVRWESGGGVKIIGSKINRGPGTGIGRFDYGLDFAVADGVNTAVLVVSGNSFENCATNGIYVRSQGTTGRIHKLTISGNELAALGAEAIKIVGASVASPSSFVTIQGNSIDGSTQAIVVENISKFVVGSNIISASNGGGGVRIQGGCSYGYVAPQEYTDNFAGPMIVNQSGWNGLTLSDHTTGPVDIEYRNKRNLPALTSTSTYVDLYTIGVPAWGSGEITFDLSALIQGKGAAYQKVRRTFTRAGSGACTVAAAGTDVTAGINFDINFDVSSASGDIKIQARLNATAGGTDMNGTASIDILGNPSSLRRH